MRRIFIILISSLCISINAQSGLNLSNFGYVPDYSKILPFVQILNERVERNKKVINSAIDKIGNHIVSVYGDRESNVAIDNFNKYCVSTITGEDILNPNVVRNLYECANNVITMHDDYLERKEQEKNNRKIEETIRTEKEREEYNKNFEMTYKGEIEVNSYAPLYRNPNMSSDTIYHVLPRTRVFVLEKVENGKYYKVRVNNIIGYIYTPFIKKQLYGN